MAEKNVSCDCSPLHPAGQKTAGEKTGAAGRKTGLAHLRPRQVTLLYICLTHRRVKQRLQVREWPGPEAGFTGRGNLQPRPSEDTGQRCRASGRVCCIG